MQHDTSTDHAAVTHTACRTAPAPDTPAHLPRVRALPRLFWRGEHVFDAHQQPRVLRPLADGAGGHDVAVRVHTAHAAQHQVAPQVGALYWCAEAVKRGEQVWVIGGHERADVGIVKQHEAVPWVEVRPTRHGQHLQHQNQSRTKRNNRLRT